MNRQRKVESAIIRSTVSSDMPSMEKPRTLAVIQEAKDRDENHKINSKKRARTEECYENSPSSSSSDTSNPQQQQQQQAVKHSSTPIMPRDRLRTMVRHFDSKDKSEFAWRIHKHQKKKHQTEYWYDFEPPEKFCSNNAFVPIEYNSQIPSNTKKNQIKKKTTSEVLKKGVQGIHFAIGWEELFGLILDCGIFGNDPLFQGESRLDPVHSDKLPELIGFRPARLDLSGTNNNLSRTTVGHILASETRKQPRKATRGIKYTTAPKPKKSLSKRRAGRDPSSCGEWIPTTVQGNARSSLSHAKKKAKSDKNSKQPVKKDSLSLEEESEEELIVPPKITARKSAKCSAPSIDFNTVAIPSKQRRQKRQESILDSAGEEDPVIGKDNAANHADVKTNQNEVESHKYDDWRPSTPPTPPVQYWLELYGQHDI